MRASKPVLRLLFWGLDHAGEVVRLADIAHAHQNMCTFSFATEFHQCHENENDSYFWVEVAEMWVFFLYLSSQRPDVQPGAFAWW